MSYITRRALSTLIPPKVASPTRLPAELAEQGALKDLSDRRKGIGAAQDAVRMQRVVSFYEKLPRGSAPEVKPKGFIGKYQSKHFGKNASATPIIHVIIGVLALGYAQNYYFHLRHHKNNAH